MKIILLAFLIGYILPYLIIVTGVLYTTSDRFFNKYRPGGKYTPLDR